MNRSPSDPSEEFAREAERPEPSLPREFWDFLRHNKKWWLAPIVLTLLLASLLILISGSSAAPWIYTLF